MKTTINRALIALNTPLMLTSDEMNNPEPIIERFCNEYDIEEHREYIAAAKEAVMTSAVESLNVGIERANAWLWFDELERFIEANCVQHKNSLGTRPEI